MCFRDNTKNIAVLTSGGDAPGMNAAVRAVVRTAIAKNMTVYGVYHGYNGLLNGDIKELHARDVADIIHRGGTMLYTARSAEFATPEGVAKAASFCKKKKIDGVVVIGGDGSFRGAAELSKAGIPCVGIPGTIDNDISCSDYTIGYDTAMNTAMNMVDNVRDTSQSHDRCSVVEVMGRHAGYLALNAGIACGACAILVPELPYDFEKDIIGKIRESQADGKQHFIIVVAEGIGGVEELAKRIETETGIESRATVLGYIQRGGSPTVRDRAMATQMGYRAVELLSEGKGNRVIASKHDEIVDYDIAEALGMKKSISEELYQIAHVVSR